MTLHQEPHFPNGLLSHKRSFGRVDSINAKWHLVAFEENMRKRVSEQREEGHEIEMRGRKNSFATMVKQCNAAAITSK